MEKKRSLIFLVVFLVVLVLCVVLFVLFFNRTPDGDEPINPSFPPSTSSLQPPLAGSDSTDSTSMDSDNDGLMDWEESLRGTDPNNPDTDGDGRTDDEEARSGRNPLEKGTDKKVQRTTDGKRSEPVPSPIVQTPLVSVPTPTIEVEPVTTPSQGESTSPTTPPPSPEPQPPTMLQNYGSILGETLRTTVQSQVELSSFLGFLKEGAGSAESEQVRAVGEAYARRADLLLAMAVPPEMQILHQGLAQRTREQADAILQMASYPSYRDISQEEWLAYVATVQTAGKAFYDLASHLNENQVSFSPSSGGQAFSLPSQ